MADRKRKRRRPGQVLGGLPTPGHKKIVVPRDMGKVVPAGQPGMGELMHDPRYYETQPTPAQVQALPDRAGPPPAGAKKYPAAPRRVIDEQDLPIMRTIPPVAKMVRISSWLLTSAQKTRVDFGIDNRVDVVLWNVSNSLIWWDTSGNPSAPAVGGLQGSGAPLPGNATLNGYNGASVSITAGEEVPIWAIGTAAGTQLVIVFEAARE